MNKEITKEGVELILRELCNRVGVQFETFDFTQDNWFQKYVWSPEQEHDFILWLARFLIDHNYVRPRWKQAVHEAQKLEMQFGWKTETECSCPILEGGAMLASATCPQHHPMVR